MSVAASELIGLLLLPVAAEDKPLIQKRETRRISSEI